MNNWRLLLLAVIAVLQPVPSFTENNLVDGRQECCDHRSNSIAPDIKQHGAFRKTGTEHHRLDARAYTREDRRHEPKNDAIRSNVKLALGRTGRSISSESTWSTIGSRLARDQERRFHKTLEARNGANRRVHDSFSRATSQYERANMDSRIRISEEDTRSAKHIGNERLHRDESRGTQRIHGTAEPGSVTPNKEIMTVFRQERDDAARAVEVVRRNSRFNEFHSESSLQRDNIRERRILDRRGRNNEKARLSRSLDSRVKSNILREVLWLRTDLREEHRQPRSNVRAAFERIDERRQRDREPSSRNNAIRRASSEHNFSTERRNSDRYTGERIDRANERIDERRQQRVKIGLSRLGSESSLPDVAVERRLASEILNSRFGTTLRNNDRINERRELSGKMLRLSRNGVTERRHESPVIRISTGNTRNQRIARIVDQRNELRQSNQPLDRHSILRESRDERAFERDSAKTRLSVRIPVKNVRDESTYRREARSVDRMIDPSPLSDRKILTLHESRHNFERRQEFRISANPSQTEVRFDREFWVRGGLRNNERIDLNRHVREQRESREQIINHLARDNERRQDRESARISQVTRPSSIERVSRDREIIRNNVRLDVRREVRDDNRESRDKIVSTQQHTRHNGHLSSRNAVIQSRIVRSRTAGDMRGKERREIDENRDSTLRVPATRLSRERIEEQRREASGVIRKSGIEIRVVSKNRDVRMGERFEVRQQENLQSQFRDILPARSIERRQRNVISQDTELNILNDRLTKTGDRQTNERSVRNNSPDFKPIMSRRLTEREVQANRPFLALDREINPVRRNIRSFDTVLNARTNNKDQHSDTRIATRESMELRFGNFEFAKLRDMDVVEGTLDNQKAMNWHMVFYTLQVAYLCGLIMKMLNEKSNNGKTRKFTSWASSNDLVKVD